MTVVYPGKDPLSPLEFLATAQTIRMVAPLLEGRDWKGMRHVVNNDLNEYLDGMFEVLLGREDLLTNKSVEFIVLVEPAELAKAQHYVDNRKFA